MEHFGVAFFIFNSIALWSFFPHLVQDLFYLYPESYLLVKAECQILCEGHFNLLITTGLLVRFRPDFTCANTGLPKQAHSLSCSVALFSVPCLRLCWRFWGACECWGVSVALLCCREEEKRGGVARHSEAAAGRAQRRAPPVLLQHPPAQHQGHEHAKVSVGSPSARSDTDTQLVLSQPRQHHGRSKYGGLVLLRFFPG